MASDKINWGREAERIYNSDITQCLSFQVQDLSMWVLGPALCLQLHGWFPAQVAGGLHGHLVAAASGDCSAMILTLLLKNYNMFHNIHLHKTGTRTCIKIHSYKHQQNNNI